MNKSIKSTLVQEQLCTLPGKNKVLMQGTLIAVENTLRTHWNQFSLDGICKQE